MGTEPPLRPPAAETMRRPGALQTLKGLLVIPPKGPADLEADAKVLNKVLQMEGDDVARELPAEHQLITDAWNEGDLYAPYLVYMPEKDRLLLLYNIYFRGWGSHIHETAAVLSSSDDHGETWSCPHYLKDRWSCPEPAPSAPAYLGNATALSYLGDGNLVLDTGEFASEQSRGFSSDFGETWRAAPLPKSSHGFPWHSWDPLLADRDPVSGELKRLCDTGYSGGMERAFAGAERVFVFPDEWHWRHDPENRGFMDHWYKEGSFETWPRMIRIDKPWTEQGEPDGVAWYASRFDMPETGSAPLVILFGAVDGDCDVFIDGAKVGEQKEPDSVTWNSPFHISLDGGLSAGGHRMVIRMEKRCEPDWNAGIYLPVWIVRDPDAGLPAQEMSLLKSHHTSMRSCVRFSYDSGRTWPEELEPPSWNGDGGVAVSEVALCRAANGTMIAGCRFRGPKYQNNAVFDQYSGLGVSRSRDNGYTWSKFEPLYDFGRMHPSLVLMPNGDIVMTYVVRLGWLSKEDRLLDKDGYPRWSIEAVVSRDNGESWDLSHRYVLAKWSGNNIATSTSTVLLPDGSLLTAFSSGYLSRPQHKGTDPESDPQKQEVCLVRWRP
jgi:hypothetical protein